ncbi:amidohydrolase [Nocardioides sp. Soil774]|uniref:amidohydrolase n=1 Tax=Nocardioides sp. Soil774 TaxID=1736408 RepID=UPI0006F47A2F|nr:amidohydrolase [Nocardioides sp. Soil774]KRE94079.1 amidohydrolase [Nocardioides sp. Soil774]
MDPREHVLAGLGDVTSWQEELYVRLHQEPELSMQETRTAAEVTRRLASFGYEVLQVGGGVVGVLRNGPGPVVLFRADMDALPVREATGLPYASTRTVVDHDGATVPVMHACGHDVHVVAALGAACLLAERRDTWSGTHVALFQPGEETAAGAHSMVEDGLVDKVPRPDVAFGQHVLTEPAAGEVAIAAGPVLSTGACVRVKVFGRGSHGSMPHLGVDPVVLGASIVTRLQTVVAREVAPGDFAVLTVGSLQAGTKANIIPDDATLLLNLRAYDLTVRDRLRAAIERIVHAECDASGCPRPPEIELYETYPLTDNDTEVTARVTAAFVDHFGEHRVRHLDPVTASEDFSVIPDAFGVPYAYWGFGGFTADQEPVPNHNPGFAPAMQPTLATGTEAAVTAVLAWLGRPAVSADR